ncbi:MAG: alkaline phosphatase, partial [Bacteroidaceae bacterium]|nr:alkaline phosphatase [Bacteroidaceae bacterium]
MERNGGKAYPKGKPLQLLVDLKTDASTLDALISLIREGGYTACFNVKDDPNAVQIVITGDKVKKEHFCNYPDFIFFDGLPHIDYTPEQRKRVPMVSAHYGKFTKWKGKGQMDKADQKRIKEAVRKAHKAGSKFRLWAFPDNENAWEMTRKLGMDFINTDHPDRVAKTL